MSVWKAGIDGGTGLRLNLTIREDDVHPDTPQDWIAKRRLVMMQRLFYCVREYLFRVNGDTPTDAELDSAWAQAKRDAALVPQLEAENAKLLALVRNLRADIAVWAHSYDTGNRPPPGLMARSEKIMQEEAQRAREALGVDP